jgi:hypothetical protein
MADMLQTGRLEFPCHGKVRPHWSNNSALQLEVTHRVRTRPARACVCEEARRGIVTGVAYAHCGESRTMVPHDDRSSRLR